MLIGNDEPKVHKMTDVNAVRLVIGRRARSRTLPQSQEAVQLAYADAHRDFIRTRGLSHKHFMSTLAESFEFLIRWVDLPWGASTWVSGFVLLSDRAFVLLFA